MALMLALLHSFIGICVVEDNFLSQDVVADVAVVAHLVLISTIAVLFPQTSNA